MDFRRLSDSELADFAQNVLTRLGGTELTAVNPAIRTQLATAIGPLPANFQDQISEAAVLASQRKAAVSVKNASREQLTELLAQTRNTLVAARAPRPEFDLCGFNYRDTSAEVYKANDPSDVSAFGYSNGVNKLSFKGNNRVGSVVYEIWRRHGDTAQWALHATTKKQMFTDAPVQPGQFYEYRVRAKATNSVSNFSNSAVVYGVG